MQPVQNRTISSQNISSAIYEIQISPLQNNPHAVFYYFIPKSDGVKQIFGVSQYMVRMALYLTTDEGVCAT